MKFSIRRMFIGAGNQSVPSSKKDFDTLREARDGLILTLAIEEKFDVLIANYAELEQELLRVALNDMVYSDENVRLAFRDDRMVFNRRLSNLLSSARMYRDQVQADLNRTAAWKAMDMKGWVKGAMSNAAQSTVEFRACESLRNATQHQEMPVYSVSRGWSRTSLGTCFVTQISAKLAAFLTRRSPDKKLEQELWPAFAPEKEKKKPARNLQNPTILLMPLVRRYVETLAKIHRELRGKLKQ